MSITDIFRDARSLSVVALATLCVVLVGTVFVARCVYMCCLPAPGSPEIVDSLIARAVRDEPFEYGSLVELRPQDLPLAREYVYAHPDWTSYQILLNIRNLDLVAYARILNLTKVSILFSTLQHTGKIDDWGFLEDDFILGPAGSALITTERDSLGPLFELLTDATPVHSLEGECEALCTDLRFRRKDVAYKFIMCILSRRRQFKRDWKERDKQIDELLAEKETILGQGPAPGQGGQ